MTDSAYLYWASGAYNDAITDAQLYDHDMSLDMFTRGVKKYY